MINYKGQAFLLCVKNLNFDSFRISNDVGTFCVTFEQLLLNQTFNTGGLSKS